MIEQKLGMECLCDKIDKHNEQTAESHKRTAIDIGEAMAEDLYRPLMQAMEGNDKYLPAFGYGKKYAEGYDNIEWST